uniref:Molybdate-anion transporter n=1 Tax=Compsopogon caeruleus TaxID=31354 RepID=A0A7S1T7F7_9RHOD|mmetsp:Transcript_12297/g.25107  ORF Transcript_12297/g.25107 Transcript_12297/m.25107 type:complete len:466 (+) Transcript_12297:85-1482(+)
MFLWVLWTTLVLVVILKGLETLRLRKSRLEQDEWSSGAADGRKLEQQYLMGYLMAVAADWLQGPYVYALYSFYGYEQQDIGILYITGFLSSAVAGTFIASLADRFGRKRLVLAFALIYALSCVTKHSGKFEVLLMGRVLGGIAYSILFSVFEAWVVCEHNARNLPAKQLSMIFARAQFGNGVLAIVAGQVAGAVAAKGTKVSPFDVSLVVLVATFLVVFITWNENYGDSSVPAGVSFRQAIHFIRSNEDVFLIGLVSTCFEGALYSFTFAWTPALQHLYGDEKIREIPHGTIFSTMMACMMSGGTIFGLLTNHHVSSQFVVLLVFGLSLLSFLASALFDSMWVSYFAFLIFEISCGLYFPAMASLRAPLIPENIRGSTLSIYRLPINIVVVVIMTFTADSNSIIHCCIALLAAGFIGHGRLLRNERRQNRSTVQSSVKTKKMKIQGNDKSDNGDFHVIDEDIAPP